MANTLERDEILLRQEAPVVNQGLKYAGSEVYERLDGIEWLTILWHVPQS